MKPSNILHRINGPVLLLAFFLALGMWYSVTVRDRLEVQLEVRLDYKGIPDNLVVTDGLINKMVVRLRGPEALLRSYTTQNITQVVNLSHLKKGTNIIPLVPDDWKPAIRAFELMEVSPPRLSLQVDTLLERTLVVDPILKSPLGKSAPTVDHVQVTPQTVALRGPESTLTAMKSVPLTIPLDPTASPGPHSQTLGLELPPQVSANPNSITASYTITSGRAEAKLERSIAITSQERGGYTISPQTLTLLVEVPEALVNSASYLQRARLSVTPPSLEQGASTAAPLRVTLPEGMTLTEALPTEVTVTRVKK